MPPRFQAMLWATVILAAAFLVKDSGLSDGAAFGVIAGLSGAAWGSMNCGRRCGSRN